MIEWVTLSGSCRYPTLRAEGMHGHASSRMTSALAFGETLLYRGALLQMKLQ